MRSRALFLAVVLLVLPLGVHGQKRYSLASPDGRLTVNVTLSGQLTWSLSYDGALLLQEAPLSLDTDRGLMGAGMRLRKAQHQTLDECFVTPVYKRDVERNHCNELTLVGRDGYDVVFRAYDDGAAYRFVLRQKGEVIVRSEQAAFRIGEGRSAYIPYVRKTGDYEIQFFNTFENTYAHTPVSAWEKGRLAFLPLLVEYPGGVKLCITESDLEHYPGMYLYPTEAGDALQGVYAPYPAGLRQGSHDPSVTIGGHNQVVTSREPYLARVPEGGNLPWRVVAVSTDDRDLLDNNLVYKLASPSRLEDTSWIRPGQVAWEWFSDRNLSGVDFVAGVNNDTYKYYIDFAARNGIPYVVLDDGWYDAMAGSAFAVVPQIDLPMLVAYGRERGVGLMLWVGYYVLQKEMERIFSTYAAMGICGFKLDAIGRDDQLMNEFYYKSAQLASRYHLVLDFHGGAKPAGINRTWPNVLNVEGVHGLEQLKSPSYTCDMVTYDVTFPFIRGIAGPADYTPGAMRNATRESFRGIWSEPMSQGTRCRQLAEYVVFESPLSMLSDTPTRYMQEQVCTDFITAIPTVWKQTLPLQGELGRHIVLAREAKDGSWYVGALNGWEARDMEVDLSFLPQGRYVATIFEDGVNAAHNAQDYRNRTMEVEAGTMLPFHLAPGGGLAVKLELIP